MRTWLGLLIAVSSMAAGQATVRGRLLDPTGAPVVGAFVHLGRGDASTDSTGRYTISTSATARQTIEFQQPGFANLRIELDLTAGADMELPDLTLKVGGGSNADDTSQRRRWLTTPDRGGLRGDVRALAKDGLMLGAPVRKAKVALHCGDRMCGTTVTDAGGRYQFENLEPGAYTIRLEQAGFYPQTQRVRVIAGFESVYDSYIAMLACIRGNCVQNPRPVVTPVCE